MIYSGDLGRLGVIKVHCEEWAAVCGPEEWKEVGVGRRNGTGSGCSAACRGLISSKPVHGRGGGAMAESRKGKLSR